MIRPANQADDDAIWNIFHAVVASGDTYVFDPHMPREQALAYWLSQASIAIDPIFGPTATFTGQMVTGEVTIDTPTTLPLLG